MEIDNKCAYRVTDNKCSALKQKKCAGCSFYITQKQLKEKKKRSEERLKKKFTNKELSALKERYRGK